MNKAPKIVFLVEDNLMFAKSFEMKFSKDPEFDIKLFGTGEEMFNYLDKENDIPNVIVLDYILNSVDPNAINGGKVLEVLKSKYKERIANSPVIMLSGSTEVKDAVELLKKGAKDYILKDNVAFESLKKSMHNIFELKQLRAEMGLYKEETKALKKRLWLTVSIVVVFVAAVGAYFLWFNG